ncbi:MAG: Ig-like domain-containing protein [Sinimarinibacterium sp.]|jgi:hypothetical protein
MAKTRSCSVVLAAFAALILSACGGGAEFGVDGGPGATPSPTDVARVILLADSAQLLSSADSEDTGVTLTARALDSGGNAVAAADLRISIPPEAGAIIPADTADATGAIQSVLTTGGDPTPRTIRATATSGTASASVDIQVVGTTIALVGPSSIGVGQEVEFVVRLEDAEGGGIGGQQVSVTSTAGTLSSEVLTTEAGTGEATFTLAAQNDGELRVEALTVAATQQITVTEDQFRIVEPAPSDEIPIDTAETVTVEWLRNGSAAETQGRSVVFSATRGSFTPTTATIGANGRASVNISSASAGGAVIQASAASTGEPTASVAVEFVSLTPDDIALQASPARISVGEQSVILAVVRDANGNLVKNEVVDFTLDDVSGGTLSAPSAVTNSQGSASVRYTASTVTSPDSGVVIRASTRSDPSVAATALLTVSGRALRITLGTGNEIFEPNETTYEYPYSVIVTDATGNPVPEAEFRLSVLPIAYAKGQWFVADTDGDLEPDAWSQFVTATCNNEDINYNGFLDDNLGEDFNNNGTLEPGNVAAVPTTIQLDDNGAGQFVITYPQDRAFWVVVELRARARVAGSETTETARFILEGKADDYNDITVDVPGVISPYGVAADCADPN